MQSNTQLNEIKMIFLNGHFLPENEAKIAPSDRGLLLADGLFETMKACLGRVLFAEKHWERLKKGADYLDIPLTLSLVELNRIIEELLLQNKLTKDTASLRLTLTRGPGPRGLVPPQNLQPTLLLTADRWVPPALFASLKVVTVRRNEFSPLAQIKSLNYLDNILAKREALLSGATEAVLLNTKGNIAEASAANIFCINTQGEIMTPSLSDGALPGVTRQIVILLAHRLSLTVFEKSLTMADLSQAREIFLTNSLIGIQAVDQVDGKKIMHNLKGTLTEKMAMSYEKYQS